jgi:hypothetical protein
MRKIAGLFAVLGVLLVLGPAVSTGQQKKDNPKKDDVTKEETTLQDYNNLAQVKEIVGKIAEMDPKASSLTFTIEWSHMEPNANAAGNQSQKLLQQQQQLMTRYYKIMAMKNSLQQQQQLSQLQAQVQQFQAAGNANLANMFRVVKSSKDYELGVMENVKVARVKLEQKYTEEGELIKYTKEEIKKMKSADMPGAYTVPFEDLKPGCAVKLYLSPPKKQDAKKSSDSTEEKKTTSGALAARPRVRMVLILDDSSPADAQDPPKKKKDG